MNLGCLVTVVASGARNLTLVVLENGIYEVTGGQQTAAAGIAVDFAGIARAAGFVSVAVRAARRVAAAGRRSVAPARPAIRGPGG